ncbi:MAG: extracellular solute-binding protein [Thermoflexaceae bacterium]|nr:extracellular solute-binding protein [Thermoflexaceae bacterium]
MRKFKKFAAVAVAAAMTLSLAACGSKTETPSTTNAGNNATSAATTEKETVKLTMWGAEEDQKMLQGMIDSFIAQYGDKANFDIQLGVESESTAKDVVLTDIEAAADVYAFASDQLPDLVNAGALLCIDDMDGALQAYAGKTVADVKAANASGSVDAASYNGKFYAYPMSADNGYFLYYDSSLVSAEDVKTWDSLLAAADKAGKKVGMTFASGWYNASFFYGAGFTTGLNADGTTTIDFNGKSAEGYTGVQVVQSMIGIAANPAFMAIADGDISNQIAGGKLCAVVSGTWDATAAQAAFGDGYAATKLPTYTLDGKQIQQGSVAGFKLVGVNAYSKNAGWAALLAEWITNEENQKIRFAEREIGPSNIAAASSDAVAANIAISALSEQSAYGVVQLVGGKYWDPTATLGKSITDGNLKADDEAGIQKALDDMVAGVTAPVE